MIWGTQLREFKIEHVIDICEGVFAYEGAMLVGALCEFIETSNQDSTGKLIKLLQLFQKRLKYGLPTETTIALYELGFSDRVISQDLATTLQISSGDKNELIRAINENIDETNSVIEKYPSYYQDALLRFIN